MNKTQQKRIAKKVEALTSGSVSLSDSSVRVTGRTTDAQDRPTLGAYLTKGANENRHGIDDFLLAVGIDDLNAVDALIISSTSTHSPVQNAKRAGRALARLAAKYAKA